MNSYKNGENRTFREVLYEDGKRRRRHLEIWGNSYLGVVKKGILGEPYIVSTKVISFDNDWLTIHVFLCLHKFLLELYIFLQLLH